MRDRIDAHKLGLIVGFFAAIVHVIWSLMVVLGFAQNYMDWMLGLHMINNPFSVAAFSWGTAIYLWVAVFVIGYILGWILAWVHNSVHASKKKK
jgi:cell division protein FtsX